LRAATGVSEARPHTWRGEDNAPRDERETGSAVRRSEAPWREPGSSPARHGRQPVHFRSGTHEARVLVRRREMAEVGPKHRRALAHEEPQGKSSTRRWPGGAPHGVLTHAAEARLGVRTVRAVA